VENNILTMPPVNHTLFSKPAVLMNFDKMTATEANPVGEAGRRLDGLPYQIRQ
jgi:hypothetical protein